MAEILSDLLAAFDEKKTRAMKGIAAALADPGGMMGQLMAQKQDAVHERNALTQEALAKGDWPGVTAQANQGIAPAPATGGLEQAAAAARSQLAHYQLPVFERLLASTLNPQHALEEARRLTNLMTPLK